jgi:hypothetical protein
MKITKILIILGIALSTGCKPFGKGSSMDLYFGFDPILFNGNNQPEFNSGGSTQPTVPNSGNPAESHQVLFTIGSVYDQTSYKTSDGHVVSISIKGATQ